MARAVGPLMAAQGTPEPWQDSGLENLYAGLPFWVNASANYNSSARSDTAQARARAPGHGPPCASHSPEPAVTPPVNALSLVSNACP